MYQSNKLKLRIASLCIGLTMLGTYHARAREKNMLLNNKETHKHSNRLQLEKSPYLLQHAENPVDWYPWGEEAFKKAREENKLIFLSIGYSTCHWCHVMAHESFEDPVVAKLMNEVFVSIKVDREERPDIDKIYMAVCQMLTGSGGWPLTIIMTADKKPFFATTYIPKENRFGKTGMIDLIPQIQDIWVSRKNEVLNSADQIVSSLKQTANDSPSDELSEATLKSAYEQLSTRFDKRHGGFGGAPKFPTSHNLLFLLRYWKRSGDNNALDMVNKTLWAMRRGGIYDHVGYGFHRYSTDGQWFLPHFEKMLYDQAMIAIAYIEAYQSTGEKEYEKTAREIFTYVLRDMTDKEGGFYSAEDADSEGEEGKFYLWTGDEIQQILTKEEYELITKVFNFEKDGNFTDEATRTKTGKNILYINKELPETASDLKAPADEHQNSLEPALHKLFTAREKRIHPHKDDKILTDWNGLMIAALAKGAQVLNESIYTEAAKKAVNFILTNMRRADGRLLHRYRDNHAAILANLDDYAFFIWGLIELYEATFDVNYLQTAIKLNNELIAHFWDDKSGGFFFTPDDGETLITRQKEIYDGAVPSGNSVSMLNLLRLGRITTNPDFEEKAAQIGRAFASTVKQFPTAHTQLMSALDFAVGPSYEIVIVGNPQGKDTREMIKALRLLFVPNKVVLLRPANQDSPDISNVAGFTKNLSSIDGKTTAYVCTNYTCNFPTTDTNKMLDLLNANPLSKKKN